MFICLVPKLISQSPSVLHHLAEIAELGSAFRLVVFFPFCMRSWSVVFQKEIASTVSPMAGGNSYPWALSFSDSFQFFPHAESLFKFISFLTVGIGAWFTSILVRDSNILKYDSVPL